MTACLLFDKVVTLQCTIIQTSRHRLFNIGLAHVTKSKAGLRGCRNHQESNISAMFDVRTHGAGVVHTLVLSSELSVSANLSSMVFLMLKQYDSRLFRASTRPFICNGTCGRHFGMHAFCPDKALCRSRQDKHCTQTHK